MRVITGQDVVSALLNFIANALVFSGISLFKQLCKVLDQFASAAKKRNGICQLTLYVSQLSIGNTKRFLLWFRNTRGAFCVVPGVVSIGSLTVAALAGSPPSWDSMTLETGILQAVGSLSRWGRFQ